MTEKEIKKLEELISSGAGIAWINPSTDVFHKVTKIVSGTQANPSDPEIDKCAMLGFSSKYVSLADADLEDFIIYSAVDKK